MKRERNDGLRKICDCPRRQWAKCPHLWHFNFKWGDVALRKSLDALVGRKVTSKTEAEHEAEKICRSECRHRRVPRRDSRHAQPSRHRTERRGVTEHLAGRRRSSFTPSGMITVSVRH
jgi:hypothetical protein